MKNRRGGASPDAANVLILDAGLIFAFMGENLRIAERAGVPIREKRPHLLLQYTFTTRRITPPHLFCFCNLIRILFTYTPL